MNIYPGTREKFTSRFPRRLSIQLQSSRVSVDSMSAGVHLWATTSAKGTPEGLDTRADPELERQSRASESLYPGFLPICPRNPANPALVTRNDAFKPAGGFSQAISANAARTPSGGGPYSSNWLLSFRGKKEFEIAPLRLRDALFMLSAMLYDNVENFGCAAARWLHIKRKLGRSERSTRTGNL